MGKRVGLACALASGMLGLVTLGASYAPVVPLLPTPPGAASIYYPGSGDYAGFRIVVDPDGRAIAIDGAGHAATQLATGVSQKFFADLKAVGPLDRVASGPCADTNVPSAATVELSTPLIITWKGRSSPQLSCAKDPVTQSLLLDAVAIQQALYVQAYRKRNLVTYGTTHASDYAAAPPGGAQYGGAGAAPVYDTSTNSYGLSGAPMTFDQFYAGGLENEAFSSAPFVMEHFSNGLQFTSPFVGSPYTGTPYTALPAASLPLANPYTAVPFSSPFMGTPYTASPFTANPFSGLQTTNPYSGSPFGSSP